MASLPNRQRIADRCADSLSQLGCRYRITQARSIGMPIVARKPHSTVHRPDRKRARVDKPKPGPSRTGPVAPTLRRITIAYRECARGAGAFWDHYTIQHATRRRTTASHAANVTPTIDYRTERDREHYAGRLPDNPRTTSGVGGGLLVLTGGNYGLELEYPRNPQHVPRDEAARQRYGNRQRHERELLKLAYRTGRPVLGLCGGSWTVLESYGGATSALPPNTHQVRRGPFIRADAAISSNFAEHDIDVFGDADHPTLLAHVSGTGHWRARVDCRLPVDSNHWAAAREEAQRARQRHALIQRPARPDETGPNANDMSAAAQMLAAKLQLLVVAARDAGVTAPTAVLPAREPTGTIEAFETTSGAPVVAVQWHAERYALGQDHKRAAAMSKALLRDMAKAGDAYEARRSMTASFERIMDRARARRPEPDVRTVFGLRPPARN